MKCQKPRRAAFNPYNAKIFLFKPWRLKIFFKFEIIMNVLVTSFQFIWTPMLWVYDHYKWYIFFIAGIVFLRQNVTSTDVSFWR